MKRLKQIFQNFIIAQFVKLRPYNVIRTLYRQMAKSQLHIETRTVEVKKGRKRYTLAIFDVPEGRVIYNLGRLRSAHLGPDPEPVLSNRTNLQT